MSVGVSGYLTVELELYREQDAYRVGLSTRDPRSQAQTSTLRRPVSFDLDQLRAEQLQPQAYGAELSRQLFADKKFREAFVRVEGDAQVSGRSLRVVLECSARELDTLLVMELVRGGTLCQRAQTSTDWRELLGCYTQAVRALQAVQDERLRRGLPVTVSR